MKIPKIIEKELLKRGWRLCENEKWRKVKGLDWACAYFTYRTKCCLITVTYMTGKYFIEILYRFPVCSRYVLTSKKNFQVNTEK